MTRLFNRFVEDMQLRNFSESTIRSYTYALKQLAAHFNKAPELINEQEIKDYFLYNRNVKHWSRAAGRWGKAALTAVYGLASGAKPIRYAIFFTKLIKSTV